MEYKEIVRKFESNRNIVNEYVNIHRQTINTNPQTRHLLDSYLNQPPVKTDKPSIVDTGSLVKASSQFPDI
jgi:hypothetical protein